jgi:hypothetical protein
MADAHPPTPGLDPRQALKAPPAGACPSTQRHSSCTGAPRPATPCPAHPPTPPAARPMASSQTLCHTLASTLRESVPCRPDPSPPLPSTARDVLWVVWVV